HRRSRCRRVARQSSRHTDRHAQLWRRFGIDRDFAWSRPGHAPPRHGTIFYALRPCDRGQGHFTRYRSAAGPDRKSTRLNSSHVEISYAVFCLKKTITHRCLETMQRRTTSCRRGTRAREGWSTSGPISFFFLKKGEPPKSSPFPHPPPFPF